MIILAVCFGSVLMFETLIYDWEKRLPPYNCKAERFQSLTSEKALRDIQLDWFRRNGEWSCYCEDSLKRDEWFYDD